MREGFLVVSMTWLFAAAIGALPYWLTAETQFASPIDSYFEAMSGFTTTGATIVTDIEGLPHGLAMWRQLTQWLGGMGIIVLALAVLPRLRVGGRQLLETELPGPEIEEMTLRIRDTAQRLWLLYIALTALMIAVLTVIAWTGLDSAMSFYEAVAHALTTLPTGGFSTQARSLEEFGAASQWAIAFFMVVAGVNFALMYRAFFRRQPRVFVRDEEFRLYLTLLALGSAVLAIELWSEGVLRGEAAIRHSVVNAVSTMTTTGYASVDFNQWPLLAAVVLVALMFVGGSAGSTGGSGEGRQASPARPDPHARARPDGAPGSRLTYPPQRTPGRRANRAGGFELRAALRRRVRRRDAPADRRCRPGRLGPSTPRRRGGGRDDSRQRRPRLRLRRARWARSSRSATSRRS